MWNCVQVGKSEHNNCFTLKLKDFGIESKICMKLIYKRKNNIMFKKPKHKKRKQISWILNAFSFNCYCSFICKT
jgi:hypothetical protein